jgi:flagellar protein FliO/FliZ
MMRLIFAVLAISLPVSVFAEVVSGAQSVVRSSYNEPFSGEALTQLVVGLLIVVAVIFVLSWAFKRFSGFSPIAKNMRVLGVLPLSAREKAILVQVGDKQLLLGVAPGRVSHLHSFEESVVDADVKTESFGARLGEALKQRQVAESKKQAHD